MSGNVIDLVRTPPNAELIEVMREALAAAEAGEFVGVIMVKLRDDASFAVDRVGHCSDLQLVGALQFAAHDLMSLNKPKPTSGPSAA